MFGKWTRTALIVATLTAGLGGFAATGAQAQELRIGIQNGQPSVQMIDHRQDRWRGNDRHNRWEDRRDRGCDARQAVRKASHMGVRRAQIVDTNRRSLTVAGRDRGGRTMIRFANARGCPVIGQR
ncbi:hypothetical protein FPY71_15875 [Aureimonas fodinaquatilis]|uniref:Antifreeze protein n=1 Tax=Aureimonas fodinaquatilis TaxID=2565783 RepID=A0A5B0DRD1_9HYPH|nr:hypothetical protein [Aureimonas fodinaquatilis]KAA0969028.1 hypothetical protein FPY71_15875 [Aureimonas fodinaquatilis]